MEKSQYIFLLGLFLLFSCSRNQPDASATIIHQKSRIANTKNLLVNIEVFPDSNCNKTINDVQNHWNEYRLDSVKIPSFYLNKPYDQNCYWTRLLFKNPDSVSRNRILYFPKGWQHLDCFLNLEDSTFEKKSIGILHIENVLHISIRPLDTLLLYVRYPEKTKSFFPQLTVREMTEESYLNYYARTNYKFLLIGALIFPFLFFLVQFLVQKDLLSLFYVIFLLGANLNLITILDGIAYFSLYPTIITSALMGRKIFVLSTFLTLFGLVKYIHVFTELKDWSRPLYKTGHILLGIKIAVALVPFLYLPFFQAQNYIIYLPWFRIPALLLVVYVLLVSIQAVYKKIKFSRILLLVFIPFFFSLVWYATRFVFVGNYTDSDSESLVLIIGYMLSLFLFGVVLGVRNNAMKVEKLRLEEQTAHLQELNQFKSRFYTNITHEFRTPLTVIKGMVGQISGNEQITTIIRRNSDRLLKMVNQLLDLSKSDSNTLDINWVKGDIIPYLQYLTESCHTLAQKKSLGLDFFSKEKSLVMDYDETKMQHILINLLSNAIKFTPEYGSVKIIAEQVQKHTGPCLKMAIKDTGKGIPSEKLRHIFDRFYQVEGSTTRSEEGSGIGLALVKELVQLLEGKIEVESEVGMGSTFCVYLPIHQNATEFATHGPSSQQMMIFEESSSPNSLKLAPTDGDDDKPRVLIIEDNADVATYIAICLQQDYTFDTALNGREGVDKALQHVPDVIICDVMMPEMDGFEVCKKLKTDRRTSHIPIVMLTAKVTQEDKVIGLSYGADAYLTKPFDKEELLVRLRNLAVQSKRLRERLSDPLFLHKHPEELETREAAFLNELRQIVESNMGNEQFGTNRLCKEIGMSRTQLHRKLKALIGSSTAKYIRSFRLHKAKFLLENSDLPIGEIAFQVGFKDFSHFSRSFFKEFSSRPSETRNL